MGCDTTGSITQCGGQWNLYNIENNPEHALYDSVIIEYNDITGFPVEYRKLIANHDELFGEDPNSALTAPISTRMTFEPVDETSILDMFGITGDDTMSVVNIPISTFTRDCSGSYADIGYDLVVPMPGDVIKTLFNDRNYEVVNISKEGVIHQAKKFVYTLILKPFRYSAQSEEYTEVFSGMPDDPFDTILPVESVTDSPSGESVPLVNTLSSEYSDNEWIEEESDGVDTYTDVDKSIFGY
jgi:hypothetical protein